MPSADSISFLAGQPSMSTKDLICLKKVRQTSPFFAVAIYGLNSCELSPQLGLTMSSETQHWSRK